MPDLTRRILITLSLFIVWVVCSWAGVGAAATTTTPSAGSIATVSAAAHAPVLPFEAAQWSTPANGIDTLVTMQLAKYGTHMANPSSDGVLIRRIYLDMIGTLPTPAEVEQFLQDKHPHKRSLLIDNLFTRDEFADYWSMRWCDILRVKAEFPINLWPNAVHAYHKWIHTAIRTNMPYDQFVRELLTSSGSNFRVPQVNFYRATSDKTPKGIATIVALTFMGTRLKKWPTQQQNELAQFFSRITYKKSLEWKEEIVIPNPAPAQALTVVYPDGSQAVLPAGVDPRQAFAAWLITPENPYFTKNVINRIWAWVMGWGFYNAADDMRLDNPVAGPEVLAYLEKELVQSGYDLRQVMRLIFNSRTYQQSSLLPLGTDPDAVQFARYNLRRMEAEVLIDALCWLGGDGEVYWSPVPEPYTYVPTENRTIALSDGSITSAFLATFGRPTRDLGLLSERDNSSSATQLLYLLNSKEIQSRVNTSPQLLALLNAHKAQPTQLTNAIYVLLLSRYPTPAELSAANTYLQQTGLTQQQKASDLAWALINSKEFLYKH